MTGRGRAALTIALVAVAGAAAGAAVDRAVMMRGMHRRPPGGPPGFRTAEQDQKRRDEMLDRMTKELTLAAPQRAGIDSIMRRTDSSFHALRVEMQPRLTKVFDDSRTEILSRLDTAQREKFAKDSVGHPRRRRE